LPLPPVVGKSVCRTSTVQASKAAASVINVS
jgi:hypothetical protein